MIPQSQRTYVKIEGDNLETTQFRVQVNSKIIDVLSNKIYSDPILAIVRELSANAADSHIVNGNPTKPFDIKLPSYLDNSFSIRDYGTGISPDNIADVYTVYGVSDKEETNSLVGMLGLGSKTIFSYNTKTATIENYFGGKCFIYSAYMGETGLPALTLLSTADSNELPGLKVTLPCSQNDVGNWQTAAKKVFLWYKVKPNFTGTKVDIPKIETVLESKENNWSLRKEDYNLTGCYACMGQISYPIKFDDTALKEEYKALMGAPVNLYFAIGELDINAGREALSYCARTKSKIISRFAKIVEELNSMVEKDIANSKYLFDARRKIAQVLAKLPSPALQRVIKMENLKFNGKPLFDSNLAGVTFYVDNNISSRRLEKRWNSGISIRTNSRYINLGERFEFLEADLKTGNQSRAKAWFESKVNDFDYLVLLYFTDTKQKETFLEKIGAVDSHLIKTSSLPAAPSSGTKGTGGKVNTSTKVMLYNGLSRSLSYSWTKSTIDIKKDSGIYVEFNRFRFKNVAGQFEHSSLLKNYISSINELGDGVKGFNKVDQVYGIKTHLIAKLDKTRWKNLFDIIPDLINKFIGDKDFLSARELENYINIGGYDTILNRYLPEKNTLANIRAKFPNSSKHFFVEKYDKIDKLITLHTNYADKIKSFGNMIKFYPNLQIPPVKVEKPKEIALELLQRYPLLPFLDYHYVNYGHVADYLVKMEK